MKNGTILNGCMPIYGIWKHAWRLSCMLLFLMAFAGPVAKAQPMIVTLGNDSLRNTNTSYPAVYGNYYHGAKHQFLLRASEISAAGGAPGLISGMAFSVHAPQGAALVDFTIRMASTLDTAMSTSSFSNATFATVYSVPSYADVAGWNQHAFQSNYFWNGTDNLLVEVCFNNTGYTNNAILNHSNVGYVATSFFRADAPGVCSNTGLSGTASFRPNVQLSLLPPPSCSPPSSPTASNITGASATLAWVENGSANEWHVEYGPAGYTPGTGTMVTAGSNPYVLNNLSPNTAYWYYVRAICGSSTLSNWAGPASFTTPCLGPVSGVFTVDANAPAGANTYNSLSELAQVLNACGINGPVTINIAANSGPYNGEVILAGIAGNDSVNTITINGNGNTIQHLSTNTNQRATLRVDGVDYLTVNNLTIKALGEQTGEFGFAVQLLNNADFNTFNNVTVEATVTSTSTNFAAFVTSSSNTSATTSGAAASNLTLTNSTIIGGYYGVVVNGPTSAPFAEGANVSNNVIRDFYLYGLYVRGNLNGQFSNNDIHRMNRTTVSTFYGIYLNSRLDNSVFNANRIHDDAAATGTSFSSYPIYGTGANGTAGNPFSITNNAIYNLRNTGTTYGIYFLSTSLFHQVYHNTVIIDNQAEGGTSTKAAYYNTSTTAAAEIDIKNNIFYINNSNGGSQYGIWFSSATPAFTSDYNNIYVAANATAGVKAVVRRGTTNYLTLADWKAAFSSAFDQNSVGADPVFTNPSIGDVAPLSSTVDNLGTNVGITTDLNGATRSATTPDLGAVEFTPISSDLALISGSLSRGVCLGNNDTLELTVRNVIGSAVDFATAPLSVSWSVAGPANSNGSFTVNSGSLAPNADLVVRLGGVDMSMPGLYTGSASIAPNSFNLNGSNDAISGFALEVFPLMGVSVSTNLVSNATTTVELRAGSPLMPVSGHPIITEICHFKTATGAPLNGWPAYLIADDYIEISWTPGADLGGYTLEQWSTTALSGSYTFPAGTVIGPNGTAIIAVGQLGSSQPSPANYYYHGNGTFSSTWGSTTAAGRVIKDPSGTIVEAVGYGTFTFPAASGVDTTLWSGNTPAVSSSGNRLEGAYTRSATNWINSGTSPQSPNELNPGIVLPSPAAVPGFSWSFNGAVIDTLPVATVGPFANSGFYTYVATYQSACGTLVDSVTIEVDITNVITYCTSFATSTADTKIDSVLINGNAFGSASTLCEGYTDNTSFGSVVSVENGGSFPLSVRSGYCGSAAYMAYGRVFVDANQDGNFDFNESVMSFGPLTATGSGAAREWFYGQVVIPSTALPGQTRMRIVYQETSSSQNIQGCGSYTYGETEDYTITITQADLSSVQLLVPGDQAFMRVAGNANSTVQASWTQAVAASGAPVSYTFELMHPWNMGMPFYTRLSDNGGAATTATFTYQELDQILVNAGIQPDQTFSGFWTVKATSDTFVSYASVPFSLNLQRGVVGATVARYAPQQNGGTTQVRGPNGLNTTKNMHAAMIVPAQEFANAGIIAGDALYNVHFTVNNGNDIPVKGFMEFWIQSTNDNAYNKGTSWSAIPGTMMRVFADSVTLPTGTAATTFPLHFANPIYYNGQSMYVAYKFTTNLALATIPLVYRANTSIPNSLASAAGNASAPDALALTNFRPELGWGKERPWYDLEMRRLYTYSRNLQNNGIETAMVAIRNNGALQDTTATLEISSGGANPSTNTYTLPAMNPDQTYYFNLPVLGTANAGFDQVMATLSNDGNSSNNSQFASRQVAAGAQSHNPATQTTGNWGFNLGSGVLYSRYELAGPQSLVSASVLIGLDNNSVGREVYVQVVDSAGAVLGTSLPAVINSSDLGVRKQFLFSSAVSLNAGSYFIGLAQPASTTSTGYYPLGVVPEPLPRPSTYYFGPIAAGTAPVITNNLYNAGLVIVIDPEFASLAPPTANFSQSAYMALMGGQSTSIFFNDLSTENPTAWSWLIEHVDPNVNMATAYNVVSGSLTGPQLELSFNTPGIYNVSLTVTNNMGNNTLVRASALIVYEETCVSSANNVGDTKIDAIDFATINTSSLSTDCERYTSYVGMNPIIGAVPQRGLGVLRFNFSGSQSIYTFAGNMQQNGWGASYDAVPLRAAQPVMTMSQGGDNLNCSPPMNGAMLSGNIAVIYRGACEFGLKAYEAQQAGAVGAIIINNVPGVPTNLGPGAFGGMVTIPVAFIDEKAGAELVNAMNLNPGFTVEMGGAGPQVGQLFTGQTLPINIKPGSCSGNFYPAHGKVWIDYNGDSQFDSSEMVFDFPGNSSFNWVSGQITVPMTASPGLRRMRVVYSEQAAANVQACGTYSWGETEDYLVEILGSFNGIVASLPVVDACAGPVSIPVTATNFNNVGAISMSILYDQNNLNFMGVSGVNPALSGGQLLSNAANGRVALSWYDVNGASSMNDTLFYLDFIGNGFSALIWDQMPGSNEFADQFGNPMMQLFNNGSYSVTTNCNEIVGVLKYGNLAGTPLNNSTVTLFNQNGPLQAVQTDAAGNFGFTGLSNGVYSLQASTSKPWGGVNATDALGVARHFTNAAPLQGIRLMAADVNGNMNINSTDALLVARRFTGQIGSFAVGDWVFEMPTIQAQGGVTSLDILGLTYGDVNASYSPAQNRVAPRISLDSRELVYVGNEAVVVPVLIDRDLSVGALSLEMRLPAGVEVLGVKSALSQGEFQYQVTEGVLRIGWFSLSEVTLQANDPVFELELSTTAEVSGVWSAEGLSEMANAWAEAYPEVGLRVPRVVRSLAGAFAASVYPNPTVDVSHLQVQLPEAGQLSIRITDALGRVVYELNDLPTAAGTQRFEIDAKVWSAGAYHATVRFENAQMSEQQHLKIQKIK